MYQAFVEELANSRDAADYKLTSTSCLGPCALGASVLVYPGGVLYAHVTPDDVHEIVEQHLMAGRPVARLVVDDASA